MAVTTGSGSRGGWSYTLPTVNLMEDPREQPSLSQALQQGVGKAHRQDVWAGPEYRNYRRTAALNRDHVKR